MFDVHRFVYTSIVYNNSVGFSIAYPRKTGNARAYKSGIGNSFDSHAFSFVFSEKDILTISLRSRLKEKTKEINLKSNRYE